ncbi:TonB-dependent receptor plug domain-containing protein [Balneola vulgaris]|uniref:TonB-dependent receptor plug domain-containing protein n=1 Tax=Balneola vulgaris TaxID=287535 RepID=UPI00037368AA|nr:TonB-dependent receptor [Balneola vulgaris]
MSNKTLLSIFAGVLLSTSSIQAQQTSVPVDTLELNTVVVTASKIPTETRQTTRPVVVIDQAEIRKSAGKDLAQLLDDQSGIVINGAFSNPGKDKGVYLQGATTQYVLILIDGQPVNDPSGAGGAVDLRLISLDNVERVEVVKGSMSTLYGSDAIAGVINVITKKPQDKTVAVNGKAAYGSYESVDLSAGVNGRLNLLGYSLNYSKQTTDGISEAKDENDAGNFDKDGFNRDALSAKFDIALTEQLSIKPFVNYTNYEGDYDGGAFADAPNKYTAKLVNPGVDIHFENDAWTVKGGYQYNEVERTFESGFGTSEFTGNIQNLDIYSTYAASENVTVLGGFNYQKQVLDDNDANTNNPDATLISPYVSSILKAENGLGAELGFRLNEHSDAGTQLTYNFSPYYNVNENIRVLASYATGFKAPTLNELFGPFGANPDLEPQKSRYIDFGIEYYANNGRFNAEVLYFNRHIDDVIIYTFGTGYENQDEQDDQGVELSANYLVNEFLTVQSFYNYLTGEQTTLDGSGNEVKRDNLIRRPEHAFGFSFLVSPSNDVNVNLQVRHTGEREDVFFNPNTFASESKTLDAFTLVNLYADYTLLEGQLTLFADIKNLFDTDYTEVYGYNTIGIYSKAGLRFNIR